MPPAPPDFLVQKLRDRRCVLFVGAGFSAPAKLPEWEGLLRGVIDGKAGSQLTTADREELEGLIRDKELTAAAERLRELIGPERLCGSLNALLNRGNRPLPETHRILPRLPFRAIITTNFDSLLEDAYDGRLPVVTQLDSRQLADLIAGNDPFIFKIHGDLTRPETIILAESDYDQMIHSRPAMQTAFESILMYEALLFVGYSVKDPDIRHLITRNIQHFERAGPPRFALMHGATGSDLHALRHRSIQVLPLASFDEVPTFFEALEHALGDAPGTVSDSPPQFFDRKEVRQRGARRSARAESGSKEPPPPEPAVAGELTRILLDADERLRGAVRTFMGGEKFDALYSLARSRRDEVLASGYRGCVVVVPTFMGSQLDVRTEKGRSRKIWPDVHSLVTGRFLNLEIPAAGGGDLDIVATAQMSVYTPLCSRLDDRWMVLPFSYDWRRSAADAAETLLLFLVERTEPGFPCHFVAHGFGCLVVRSFMQRYARAWDQLGAGMAGRSASSRCVMIGPSNHGSFAWLGLLCGTDRLLQMVAKLDLRHDAQDIRRVFASFPSVYEALPSPFVNPGWESLYDAASYGALRVSQKLLDQARSFQGWIREAVDPDRMVSILGHGHATTSDLSSPHRLDSAQEWMTTAAGDGRTTHAMARLERKGTLVREYFAHSTHADLIADETVIDAVVEILETGQSTKLPTQAPA